MKLREALEEAEAQQTYVYHYLSSVYGIEGAHTADQHEYDDKIIKIYGTNYLHVDIQSYDDRENFILHLENHTCGVKPDGWQVGPTCNTEVGMLARIFMEALDLNITYTRRGRK